MRTSFLPLAAAFLLAASATAASANEFLVQADDLTDNLSINTYEDGVLIQLGTIGGESYGSSYGLQWNPGAALASDTDIGVNILEADGSLSDTWHLFGAAGDTSISIPFFSDSGAAPLSPLVGFPSIFETGNWQTVADFTLNNGDHFVWQFRSDVGDVPEPATWALILVGFGGLGAVMRSRRRTLASAA